MAGASGQGDDGQKPFLAVPATDPLRDDLGHGIVTSALTCHLCGHLKQCHSQEEAGKAQIVASPAAAAAVGTGPPASARNPLRPQTPHPQELHWRPASLRPLAPGCLRGGSALCSMPPASCPELRPGSCSALPRAHVWALPRCIHSLLTSTGEGPLVRPAKCLPWRHGQAGRVLKDSGTLE